MRQNQPSVVARGFAAGLLAVGLWGCSDDSGPVAQSFPPLHYEYLTPLRLNIATVDVADQADVPDGDLSSQSPVPPETALERMARDRLVAAGPSGTATFTVTEASITRGGGGLTERLSVHLDIASADGARAGYAEAHVTRRATGDDTAGPAALYNLTRLAMQDMNVEFEYQVRHSLHDWIVSGDAVEAPVQQAPLDGSGPLPLAPASPPGTSYGEPGANGPLPLAPPPDQPPPDQPPPDQPPPQMSPPPGFLAPPGAVPQVEYPPPSSQAVPPAGGY